MALFIAAVALTDAPLAPSLSADLRVALAPAGEAQIEEDGDHAIAFVDFAIWPGASSRSSAQQFSVIAADPVYCEGEASWPRPEGIDRLLARIQQEGAATLRDAEGTFAGVVWNRTKKQLLAFTDKLGVRPLYWARTQNHLFLASTRWALHGLPMLALTPDWQAAAEAAAFGYPLGDRTLVRPISVLGGGHCIEAGRDGFADQPYWTWTELRPMQLQGDALLAHIEHAFHDAVDRRPHGQTKVMAFLTGGMDSRLIVSRLREGGRVVHSLNFAPPGSMDLVFGGMVAERLGCKHFEYSQGAVDLATRLIEARQAWRLANPDPTQDPEHMGLIWSGDGGSVGLGHVRMSTEAVRLARERGLDAAARHLQAADGNWLSPLILRRSWRRLADAPLDAMLADLRSREQQVEPGRNCHLFFMLNDQRRHLAEHVELLHLRRFDLVLPFYDGRFVSAVLSNPVDEFLDHGLYNRLMPRLPMQAGQIPWQSYPGHHPCPIPFESTLRSQWQGGWFDKREARRRDNALMRRLLKALASAKASADVLSRPTLAAVALASMVGMRSRQYLISNCQPFLQAEQIANRRTSDGPDSSAKPSAA